MKEKTVKCAWCEKEFKPEDFSLYVLDREHTDNVKELYFCVWSCMLHYIAEHHIIPP